MASSVVSGLLFVVLIAHLASCVSASLCSKFSRTTITCSRCASQSTSLAPCSFCPHDTTGPDPTAHCHHWGPRSRHKCAVPVKGKKNDVCLGRTEQVHASQDQSYFVGSIYVDQKGLMCKNVPKLSSHKLGREVSALAADKSFPRATKILGSNTIQYLRRGVIAVRGDHRHPEEVFRTGFKPKRSDEKCVSTLSVSDADRHQVNSYDHTYCHFISTSLCTGVAAGAGSWVYVMVVPESYDLHWGKDGADLNVELIALGDVPPQYIYAARSVEIFDDIYPGDYLQEHIGSDKFVSRSSDIYSGVMKEFNDFVEFNTGFDQSIVTKQEAEHMLKMLYVKRAQGNLVDDMSYAESGSTKTVVGRKNSVRRNSLSTLSLK